LIDIVGNNIPVFFIQDAIKFPDLIHAVKPKPDSEIPQGMLRMHEMHVERKLMCWLLLYSGHCA
jgi:catalase